MDIYILIGTAMLLFISVLASKISDRFGIPALLLFLILGMFIGADGPGGIYFDNPVQAQFIGIIALILILFSGGLETEWSLVRRVIKEGLLLATLGVFITALVVGVFVMIVLGVSLIEGLLLGSIVSSTDAAAVFSVLRSKGISLKGRLKPLLELESGSNDPMAIFLTVGMIQLITQPELSILSLLKLFVVQMFVGSVLGYGMGRLIVFLIKRLKLGYEGLYPVLTLSLVFLTFGVTDVIGGSGFLAVYVAGIVLGHYNFIGKKNLLHFHNGLAWLMQIAMFLTLGLLVFPVRLVPIIGIGLLIAGCLMFIARPIGVFIGLLPSTLNWREKTFIAWVGLRGAAPIILATFPLLAKIPQSDLIFNVVFFIVLMSVLLQGTSIPQFARLLRVNAPISPKRWYPIEYTPMDGLKSELKEFPIMSNSELAGKSIVELGLPAEFLIILIARDDEFILPSGKTILLGGDILLVLSDKQAFDEIQEKFNTHEN